MKKALSLVLAVIMLMSTMVLCVSAADYEIPYKHNECLDNHFGLDDCRCCIYCDNKDTDYIRKCATYDETTGIWSSSCCNLCNGLMNCNCGCECCPKQETNESGSGGLLPEDVQDSLVDSFRNALNKVKKVFDDFFDRIFEFLRIEDFFA